MDEKQILIIIFGLGLLFLSAKIISSLSRREKFPYHKTYLLTKHEYAFYHKLRPIADRHNLQILAKVRLADLVDVDGGLDRNTRFRYLGKISSKHIDFVIADDMKVLLLIELDDNSHNSEERIERDKFVEKVLEVSGYKLIRTLGETDEISEELRCIMR